MESDSDIIDNRPSVAELIVLIRYIMEAMYSQRRLASFRARRKLISPNFVFPVSSNTYGDGAYSD